MIKRFIIGLVLLGMGCLGFLGIYFPPSSLNQNPEQVISSVLSSLTKEDKAVLEHFLRELLIQESGFYTLFGDKPITMSNSLDLNKCSDEYIRFIFTRRSGIPYLFSLNKGWDLWRKIQPKLSNSNFCLRRFDNQSSKDIEFILINKKAFLETAEAHIETFQTVLNSNITSHDLLSEFMTQSFLIRDVLKGHTSLIGILFGFGKENSVLFERIYEIDKRLNPDLFVPEMVVGLEVLLPSEGYSSLEEEKAALEHGTGHLDAFDETPLRLPGFKAILDDPETLLLKQKYTDQRGKILPLLEKDDFLKQVLLRLCS